ncbi:HepT-like ribonuclease domain-containing protein [Veillonella montpellierensis]|uniref:HepT-like ribonuclease domain-containing protein n=1 Tax=Veillonella montpellierensis TaxID=187328 RepID=UPI0023F739CE|nr:HepT-like ribonuclease domain-containing protein [Veillonella montpellierensis]
MKNGTVQDKINLEEIMDLTIIISNRLKRINFNKMTFSNDDFIRDSFIPPLMHIGESVNHLNADIAEEVTSNHAKDIIGMRNRLAYAYLGIDERVLWKTITNEVPKLGLNTINALEKYFNITYSKEKNILIAIQKDLEQKTKTTTLKITFSKPKENDGLER